MKYCSLRRVHHPSLASTVFASAPSPAPTSITQRTSGMEPSRAVIHAAIAVPSVPSSEAEVLKSPERPMPAMRRA